MKTEVEPLEGNKVRLSVEVDAGEFDKAVDAAYRSLAKEVRLPGFRPGKAPRKVLQARLGPNVGREEALRQALPGYYTQALRETEVDAIAPPDIDVKSGQEGDGPLSFEAVVEVRPTVAIPGYDGLRVTVPSPEVTDDDVQEHLDRLRAQSGELQPVDRAGEEGDFLTISVTAESGGEVIGGWTSEEEMHQLGSQHPVPSLDDRLRGAKIGDILAFEVGEGDEAVAVRVVVKDIKERVLPEATDEWAQDASEFDTVEELRADIRKRLAGPKWYQARMAQEEEVTTALTELVVDDPPEALVGSEMERQLHQLASQLQGRGFTMANYLEATGQTQEGLLGQLRESATKAVKLDLALRALADSENIEVSEEDVESHLARIAQSAGMDVAAVRRQLDQEDGGAAVRSGIRKTKALEWLLEHVAAVDAEGREIDPALLSTPPELPPTNEGEAE
ncbi:MAG: trigger factor [Actinobacteria bacterium]|nr:trigger factor [Actinomycetota bacterium]